jgi:hypothetical protein
MFYSLFGYGQFHPSFFVFFLQVYLFSITLNRYKITCGAGGYDKEEKAARAYDLAALKYWGANATTNYPVSDGILFFICSDTEEKCISISYGEKISKLSLHSDTLLIMRRPGNNCHE